MSRIMELLEATRAPQKPPLVERILTELDDEDRTAVETALANPAISSERLSAVLAAAGHPVSPTTIRQYRRAMRRQEGAQHR